MTAEALAVPSLWELCLRAAAAGEYWRVQRHQLACLPEEAANELLRRLLEQRRVGAPQLELFRFCATSVHLAGPAITPAWLAYLGDYPALRELRLERCPRLRDEHLRHLQTLAPTLQTLSLSGCGGLGGGAGGPLAALTRLRALDLSGTSVGEGALLQCLPALPGLTSLSLADVAAASDAVCEAAGGALSGLQRLVLSATAVGDAGVSHLERLSRLTALDLSLTQVHLPPLCTSLRQLSMMHCQLGVEDEAAQEAAWLHLGAALPQLEELHLAHISLLPPLGAHLLHQLVAGAAPRLGRLDLSGAAFSGDLGMLAGAAALTWLDLSGTPVADHHLADLACLSLRRLSLADTGVGDEGVGQLLAMQHLTSLDIRKTRVGDTSWAALLQLPSLAALDASGCQLCLEAQPDGQPHHRSTSLTSLRLESSRLGNRGCRQLAAALPALRELRLVSRAVDDRGLKALCTLPKLEALELQGCAASDPGLLSALPRCPSLCRLSLQGCWLASAAGVQAAAAAAVQAGGRLRELELDGIPVAIADPRASASGIAAAAAALTGMQLRSAPAGLGALVPKQAVSPPASLPGSGSSGNARPRAGMPGARLSPDVLAHDERMQYSRDELLHLARVHAAPAAPAQAPGPGLAAGVSSSSTWHQSSCCQLVEAIPPDLRLERPAAEGGHSSD